MQHVQQLTQQNEKLQSEIYTERVNTAKAQLQSMQKVAAADRSLQVQQLETQDEMMHMAMDKQELTANIKNQNVEAVIDFLAKVVVPLIVAQQKQAEPVGPEANQLAAEVSPQGANA
jgi:hypothetical protein